MPLFKKVKDEDIPTTSKIYGREFDFDKEAKYEEIKTEENALEAQLKKLLGRIDSEKEAIEEKLIARSELTKEDADKLEKLMRERDVVARRLEGTKDLKASHTKTMLKKTKEEIEKLKKLREVFRLIRRSEKVDLCFMVDCTGSMRYYIAAITKQIHSIVRKLEKSCSNLKVRLSFLGYRDLHDASNQFSILDFTENVNEFHDFVKEVIAFGGGDTPEDIAGAMRKANDLSWANGTRVVIHIADAPAHGSQYNFGGDDYPEGVGISLPEELKQLKTEHKVQYYFAHIKRSFTEKMIKTLNSEMGHEYIQELSLSRPDELTRLVTTTVRRSIGSSYRSESGDCKENFGEIDARKPCWDSIKKLDAIVEKVHPFESAADLRRSDLVVDKIKKTCKVQIAPTPMGKGSIRAAFYGTLDDEEVIFKKFLQPQSDAKKEEMRYLQSIEESEIARFLAEQFNKSGELPGEMEVKFLEAALVRVQYEDGNDDLYCMEHLLPEGKSFQKYVDNAAHWDEYLLDEVNTLPLFARWTHDFTEGYMMVADLQGIEEDNEYILTDPVILCKDISRFGVTNLGPAMITKYIDSLETYD
jgi:hypothetical protein